MTNKYRFIIGVDTGVNTGFSIWDSKEKRFIQVETIPIHIAIEQVRNLLTLWGKDKFYVRVEDARKRKWFGTAGREQLQGAGSIKRDAKIWEDFLLDLKINFELVPPKSNKTKLTAESFRKITGWEGKTNVHNRDASMLVFGL